MQPKIPSLSLIATCKKNWPLRVSNATGSVVDAPLPPWHATRPPRDLRDARGNHGVLRLVLARGQRVLLRPPPALLQVHTQLLPHRAPARRRRGMNAAQYVDWTGMGSNGVTVTKFLQLHPIPLIWILDIWIFLAIFRLHGLFP